MHLLAEYDSVLRMHLECIHITQSQKKKPQVTLLSNRTQNDLIRSLRTQVRNVILKEIKEAKMFSILLDETTDVSHSEQVSFVVRFVHELQIKKRFIQVCHVKSTTGQDLEEVVMALLSENGLNAENIRGQGYDGAANMSASYKGLQARIQRQNEKALFVHCHALCLNLVLVETAKSSPHFVHLFNLVERLYTFLSSSSKRHAAFIEMQKLLYAEEKTWELKQLSDTRWTCRENALKVLQKVFSAVMQLLKKISDSNPPDPAVGDALLLFCSIHFEFILCLEVATPVFQETAVASAALQLKDVDLAVSYTLEGGRSVQKTSRTEDRK